MSEKEREKERQCENTAHMDAQVRLCTHMYDARNAVTKC